MDKIQRSLGYYSNVVGVLSMGRLTHVGICDILIYIMRSFETPITQIPARVAGMLVDEVVACKNEQFRRDRNNIILDSPPGAYRSALRVVHSIAPLLVQPTMAALALTYKRLGYEHLGSGASTSALLGEGSMPVAKIVRGSGVFTPEKREALASHLRYVIGVTRSCHGDKALDTVVDSAYVLGNRAMRTYVALIQPYSGGVRALSAQLDTPTRGELRLFAERSLDMMVPLGLAPDLVGKQNVLVVPQENGTNRVVLVDTVPLEKGDPTLRQYGVWSRNIGMLEALASKSACD